VVQGGSTQLVALDRDASGNIVTMGPVVATTGELRVIDSTSVRVTGEGAVEARVGDYQRCCGDDTPQTWQVRGYRWNGHQFRQVEGPAAFPLNPSVTETTASAGDLVLGPAVDGFRHGMLTVTVRHVRGTRPHRLLLYLTPPAGVERDGSAWPPIQTDGPAAPIVVDVASPASGGSESYTFAFRRPATSTGGELTIEVRGSNAAGRILGESNPFELPLRVAVRTVD
jgi:hypothetical protein